MNFPYFKSPLRKTRRAFGFSWAESVLYNVLELYRSVLITIVRLPIVLFVG